MKDKRLIYHAEPCTIPLADPAIQSLEDVRATTFNVCPYYSDRRECSPPFGCVQLAGAKVARYVIQFYSEASEETLALEVDRFRRQAPLPPDQAKAYIDTSEYGYRKITDPVILVERVREYAHAVLNLKPGERIFRSPEETYPLPVGLGKPVTAQKEKVKEEIAKPVKVRAPAKARKAR